MMFVFLFLFGNWDFGVDHLGEWDRPESLHVLMVRWGHVLVVCWRGKLRHLFHLLMVLGFIV
jgi:hypothetical protein